MRSILTKIAPNCKIFEVPVNSCKGPVEAVHTIKDYVDETRPVIISYCDYSTKWNFDAFIKDIEDNNLDGSIMLSRISSTHVRKR